ncbi:MAG: hypothetical protein ABSE05_17465, partial [Syntrophales bacterium]
RSAFSVGIVLKESINTDRKMKNFFIVCFHLSCRDQDLMLHCTAGNYQVPANDLLPYGMIDCTLFLALVLPGPRFPRFQALLKQQQRDGCNGGHAYQEP